MFEQTFKNIDDVLCGAAMTKLSSVGAIRDVFTRFQAHLYLEE